MNTAKITNKKELISDLIPGVSADDACALETSVYIPINFSDIVSFCARRDIKTEDFVTAMVSSGSKITATDILERRRNISYTSDHMDSALAFVLENA